MTETTTEYRTRAAETFCSLETIANLGISVTDRKVKLNNTRVSSKIERDDDYYIYSCRRFFFLLLYKN